MAPGGTLALLVAAATADYKAIFAFGPTRDPMGYGQDSLTYDVGNERECALGAPIRFLDSIRCPTFVIEGERGNTTSMNAMKSKTKNPMLRFTTITGAGHFDLLYPLNSLLAKRVARTGGKKELGISGKELQDEYDDFRVAMRYAGDLGTMARMRSEGAAFGNPWRPTI